MRDGRADSAAETDQVGPLSIVQGTLELFSAVCWPKLIASHASGQLVVQIGRFVPLESPELKCHQGRHNAQEKSAKQLICLAPSVFCGLIKSRFWWNRGESNPRPQAIIR